VEPTHLWQDARPKPSSRHAQLIERRGAIVKAFAEAGFVDVLVRSGFAQHVPFRPQSRLMVGDSATQSDRPARLKAAHERLGGAFVKLGQALSSRPDLVPPEYISELQRLQDAIAPMPLETVREVIERELGAPAEDVYADFSATPLGSGSIGQVHAAQLHDGTAVVVKVQRPEAPTLIDLDLDLMAQAARMLSGTPWAEDVDLVGVLAEFSEAVRSELDFSAEARDLDRFDAFFAGDDSVSIPTVHWTLTTGRVLTMSRLEGIALNRPDDIRKAGGEMHALVEHGVSAYLRMVFDLRRFHSDPHPGNLMALPGDAIGFVDFGRVSTISEHALDKAADCLLALEHNDAASFTEVVLQATYAGPNVDRSSLRLQVQEVMDRYHRAEIADTMGLSAITEILDILRQHHLRLPSEYTMLFTTLGVLAGTVLRLDPETRLQDHIQPHIRRIALQRYTPERIGAGILSQARQYLRFTAHLPDALDGILTRLSTGELGVRIKADDTDQMLDRAELMVNRVSLTILLSAMTIAIALTTGQAALPSWMSYAANGLLLLVFLVAVWHFASIVSADRRRTRGKRWKESQ